MVLKNMVPVLAPFDPINSSLANAESARDRGTGYLLGEQSLDSRDFAIGQFGTTVISASARATLPIISGILCGRSIREITNGIDEAPFRSMPHDAAVRTRPQKELGNGAVQIQATLDAFARQFRQRDSHIAGLLGTSRLQRPPIPRRAWKGAALPRSRIAAIADLHPAFEARNVSPFFRHGK